MTDAEFPRTHKYTRQPHASPTLPQSYREGSGGDARLISMSSVQQQMKSCRISYERKVIFSGNQVVNLTSIVQNTYLASPN